MRLVALATAILLFPLSGLLVAQSAYTSNGLIIASEIINETSSSERIFDIEAPYRFEFDFDIGTIDSGLTVDDFDFDTSDLGEWTVESVSNDAPFSFNAGGFAFDVAAGADFDLAVDEDIDTLYFATDDVLLPSGFSADSTKLFLELSFADGTITSDNVPAAADYEDVVFGIALLEFENLDTPSGQSTDFGQVQVLLLEVVPEPSGGSLMFLCLMFFSIRRSKKQI